MTFIKKLNSLFSSTANDERIPLWDKRILSIMIILLISPLDFIPDWISTFGLLDDLILISVILDYFFNVIESRVLLSHFPWDMKAFARIRTIARSLQFLVPQFLIKKMWKYEADPF